MAYPEEIRRAFENPPIFSVTVEEGELLIHWGNSLIMRHANPLVDHLVILEDDHTFIAFPTMGNGGFLDTLEGYGWNVEQNVPTVETIEFAADQIIKEAMAYQSEL